MTDKDEKDFEELTHLCYSLSLKELRRFCIGTLRAATIGQQVLLELYGIEEFDKFNNEVESGKIRLRK